MVLEAARIACGIKMAPMIGLPAGVQCGPFLVKVSYRYSSATRLYAKEDNITSGVPGGTSRAICFSKGLMIDFSRLVTKEFDNL